MRLRIIVFLVFLLILACVLALQVLVALDNRDHALSIMTDLQQLQTTSLEDEKTRQEIIDLRIQNEQGLLVIQSVLTNLGALVGVFVTVSGGWIAFSQYLDFRQRERLDRAANTLNELWQGIASENPHVRASCIAGLQQFISEDKKEFHDRIASALALVGRMDNELIVMRTLTPVIEHALREIPNSMRKVSWQGLKLFHPDFSGLDLSNYDLRDAVLKEADFRKTKLNGAQLDAANLYGAQMDGASLVGAYLRYADLGSASLKEADLRNADLRHIKLLHADLAEADLRGAHFLESLTNWRLAKNWRSARLDAELQERLLNRYGPMPSGTRILMLMWEFYPLMAGGGWTAAYHLLLNLRKRGVHVVVAVPHAPSQIDYTLFGHEIEVLAVGPEPITVWDKEDAAYSWYSADAVGSAYAWLRGNPETTPQPRKRVVDPDGDLSFLERIQRFEERICEKVAETKAEFDIVHAHDWVTFGAAEMLSRQLGRPWVAHFHSTEFDRNEYPSRTILAIEKAACERAAHIVTPSERTKQRLQSLYAVDPGRITVVANSLSEQEEVNVVGEFHTRKVVFLGRLSWQKGPDLFVEIAKQAFATYKEKTGWLPSAAPFVAPSGFQPFRALPAEQSPKIQFVLYGSQDGGSLRTRAYVREADQPIAVEPLAKHVPYAHAVVSFESIQPILYDAETGNIELLRQFADYFYSNRYQRWGETDENSLTELEKYERIILRRGFTAYPYPDNGNDYTYYTQRYTHRIVVNDRGDGFHLDYLVNAVGLRQLSVRTWQVVEFKPFIDWKKRNSVFDGASLLVVPSRHEPFGYVILEAMQAGVPVMYAEDAGAGEFLQSGIRINPEKIEEVANQIVELLLDTYRWQQIVDEQLKEIGNYPKRGYEEGLIVLWDRLSQPIPAPTS